jgi:hypothetical protein
MTNNLIVKKLNEDYHKYLYVNKKESTVDFHGSTLLAEELCRTLALEFARHLASKKITSFRKGKMGEEIEGIERTSPDYQLLLGDLAKRGDELFGTFIKEYYGTETKS